MDVDRVAARHTAVPRHVLNEAVIVIANYERVVQQLLELPICAEVHHVRGHRGTEWAQSPRKYVRQIREEGITRGDIAVVDHKVCVVHRSIGGANTGRSPVAMDDLINLAVDQDASAPLLDDLGERLNDAVDATLRVPDPICNLQIGEGRVDGGDATRISANEE